MEQYIPEFEKRMMEKANISRHHDFAYVLKTAEMARIIYNAREDFPLTEIPINSMSIKALKKYCHLYRVSILKWFGEE